MAKKALKRPDLPEGERTKFFDLMRKLVLEYGDPSVERLAEEFDYSHQAIYKALTGPRMPSRAITAALAKRLAGPRAQLVLEAWQRGVEEERERTLDTGETPAPPGASAPGLDPPERVPSLSPREKQILSLYASGMTARGIADEMSISVHTVNTHIKNVRIKFDQAGLHRRGKSELIAEARNAGLVRRTVDQ